MTKPDEAPRLKEWASASEISEILGVSRQTVNKMIHSGEFASLHISGAVNASKPLFMVRRKELDKIKGTRVFSRSGQPEAEVVSDEEAQAEYDNDPELQAALKQAADGPTVKRAFTRERGDED